MSFLSNYFALRGIQLGDKRTTLETAIEEAYARKGITDDIATHDNESPTLRDVLDILKEMVDNPEGSSFERMKSLERSNLMQRG